MSRLAELLDQYRNLRRLGVTRPTIQQIELMLKAVRFDGPVTYHYRGGVPRIVEAGKPFLIEIGEGVEAQASQQPAQQPPTLDSPQKSVHSP